MTFRAENISCQLFTVNAFSFVEVYRYNTCNESNFVADCILFLALSLLSMRCSRLQIKRFFSPNFNEHEVKKPLVFDKRYNTLCSRKCFFPQCLIFHNPNDWSWRHFKPGGYICRPVHLYSTTSALLKIGWCDTVELYSSNNVNFTLEQTGICIKHWLITQPFVKSYINLQTTATNATLNVTAIQRSISVAEWQGAVNLEMKD